MKRILLALVAIPSLFFMAACQTDTDKASYNLSQAAENFEIVRRVVFYNGITGGYMLEVVGLCSIEDQGNQLELTCKEESGYKKHFLGLSDNVTYFVEQVNSESVSVYHTRIIWKPQSIIPDIDVKLNGQELLENQNTNATD